LQTKIYVPAFQAWGLCPLSAAYYSSAAEVYVRLPYSITNVASFFISQASLWPGIERRPGTRRQSAWVTQININ
jgi:hypothetical protein